MPRTGRTGQLWQESSNTGTMNEQLWDDACSGQLGQNSHDCIATTGQPWQDSHPWQPWYDSCDMILATWQLWYRKCDMIAVIWQPWQDNRDWTTMIVWLWQSKNIKTATTDKNSKTVKADAISRQSSHGSHDKTVMTDHGTVMEWQQLDWTAVTSQSGKAGVYTYWRKLNFNG
jgi:hypothetical protein